MLEAKDSIICLTVYSPLDRVPRMKIFVISNSLKFVGAQRRSELHVIIAKIEKIDNFLQFVETGFAKEIEHLIQNDEEIKEEINKQIMVLRKQGKSLREIAKKTDTPKSTVDDIIKRNEKKQIDLRCVRLREFWTAGQSDNFGQPNTKSYITDYQHE